VVSFNGATLVVRPEGDSDTLTVGVRPATRMMEQAEKSFSDIQVGDFIGATLVKNSLGVPTAQELHIFPKALQGSGEGLYPAAQDSPTLILNGTVGQMNAGRIGVKFRGAAGEGAYNGGQGCKGRAPDDLLAGCQGSVIISVPAATPVLALVDADKTHVKPGAVLALSLMSGPDGKPVTPGFTIQSVATPALGDAPKPAKSAVKAAPGRLPPK
jgi:hypothetical protein